MVDGEAIERNWANLNPAAFSTREMGGGGRTDLLDAKVARSNFRATTHYGM